MVAILATLLLTSIAGPVISKADDRGHGGWRPLDDVRTTNGWGTHEADPERGAAGVAFLRLVPARYGGSGDGSSMYTEPDMPNARAVSNALNAAHLGAARHPDGLSDLVTQWGQFLDHDLTLTDAGHTEMVLIPTDAGDPWFRGAPIPMSRSAYDPETGGPAPAEPRAQMNMVTAYIDASMVYGSDDVRASALRAHEGGRLLMTDDGLMPRNEAGLPNAPNESPHFFLAGDVRANEQPGLAILTTLFVREHNRLADRLVDRYGLDPDEDDEVTYQMARRIVGAEIQMITYEEWLPALLGSWAPDPREAHFDPDIDPGITNGFATAFFRFGHSTVVDELPLLDERGRDRGVLRLSDGFFDPDWLREDPRRAEWLLRGCLATPAQDVDPALVDSLRNRLFGPPGAGGIDLAAIDVERGRDHGLPGFNAFRAAYGLAPHASLADMTTDPRWATGLTTVYDDVDEVDPFIGMLVEPHVAGGGVGETLAAALAEQFARLRDGDPFFYTQDPALHPGALRGVIDLRHWSLQDVLEANTELDDLPRDLFHVAGERSGDDDDDEDDDDERDEREPRERDWPGRGARGNDRDRAHDDEDDD